MIGALLGIGSIYWVLKGEKSSDTTPTAPDAPEAPQAPPKALEPQGDDYRVEKVGAGDQNNIYLLEGRRGVLYDDGSGGYSWESMGYIRGDFPSGFTRAPTSLGGTISFEINEVYYENVLVYATEQEAIDADKKEEPSPTDPQKQPEDDDSTPTQPSLPTRPDFGGGLGGGYTPFGGGF